MSDIPLTPEEIEKNREALRKRFQTQSNLVREKKEAEKEKKSKSQNSLENHPMYQTLKNIDTSVLNNLDSMNKMIETMASKFTNDSKQKKQYKKKVKELLEQLKSEQKNKTITETNKKDIMNDEIKKEEDNEEKIE